MTRVQHLLLQVMIFIVIVFRL